MTPHLFTPLPKNQLTHDLSRDGSRDSSALRRFPSWEGSGVGPWALGANCGRGVLSRRDMLRRCACGFGYLALTSLLAETARLAAAADNNPLAPRPPHFPPRARRIIFLFMPGGPSQVDTFDPKPLLARDRDKAVPTPAAEGVTMAPGKLLASPWEFKKHGDSGVEISSLFPQVANFADDLCIIRSLHTNGQAHGQAIMKLHTGSENQVRPSIGAWVLYGLGTENQNRPGFITISPPTAIGGPQAYGSAFLPAIYQGTAIGSESTPLTQAQIRHIRNPETPLDLQRQQLDFIQTLNLEHLKLAKADAQLEGVIESYELAFRMQTEAPKLTDISGESKATLALYGIDQTPTDNFGRQCLLARRFAERGVRFHDLHATILHLLGLDHKRLTFRNAGRDFRLTDVAGNVVKAIFA